MPINRRNTGTRSARTQRRFAAARVDHSRQPSPVNQADRSYCRARDLGGLLPLWPEELWDDSLPQHQKLLHKLARALRRERQRGLAGHWTYDLNRHASLLKAYRSERAAFALRTGGATPSHISLNAPATGQPEQSQGAQVIYRGVCQAPSSWPVRSAPPRSSAPPSGSLAAVPTCRGNLQATDCNASASAASGI